jgi:hypothetical protein
MSKIRGSTSKFPYHFWLSSSRSLKLIITVWYRDIKRVRLWRVAWDLHLVGLVRAHVSGEYITSIFSVESTCPHPTAVTTAHPAHVLGFVCTLPVRLHDFVLRHKRTLHYKVYGRTPWKLLSGFEHHFDQSKLSQSLNRYDRSGRECVWRKLGSSKRFIHFSLSLYEIWALNEEKLQLFILKMQQCPGKH